MHQKQHQQQNYRPVLELLIVISISEIYFFLSVQFCSVSVLLLLLAIVVAVCWLVRWLVGRLVGCCCQEAVSELVVAACGAVGIGNYTEAHTLRTVHNSHTHGLFWTQAVRQTVVVWLPKGNTTSKCSILLISLSFSLDRRESAVVNWCVHCSDKASTGRQAHTHTAKASN